jgi:hypothetical protein
MKSPWTQADGTMKPLWLMKAEVRYWFTVRLAHTVELQVDRLHEAAIGPKIRRMDEAQFEAHMRRLVGLAPAN